MQGSLTQALGFFVATAVTHVCLHHALETGEPKPVSYAARLCSVYGIVVQSLVNAMVLDYRARVVAGAVAVGLGACAWRAVSGEWRRDDKPVSP